MTAHPVRDQRRVSALVPVALASVLSFASVACAQTVQTQTKAGPAVAAPARGPLRAPLVLKADKNVNADVVDQKIDAVFGIATIPTPEGNAEVTVRAYAPSLSAKDLPNASIPGPTIVFSPGDLLRLRFSNQLNATANPALNAFDSNIQRVGAAPGGFDDIRDHAAHEISIPNDSNVTNLHVHGLHVDPKQDNVTLLILPQDYSPGNLSPELQRFVPTINRWWTRTYQYKIPADHIPGTYWYHSHKHGSTSTQVENGMAGTLVMLPKNPADDIIPSISGTQYDRVMMVQEIQNFGAAPNVGGGSTVAANLAARKAAKGSGGGGGGGGGKGGGGGGGGGKKAGKGPGGGKGGRTLLSNNNVPVPTNNTGSIVTLNGQYQPTMTLPAGQVERWRFIIAGANHTAAGSLWVGKYVLPPRTSLPADFVTAVNGMTTVAIAQQYTAANNPTQFPNTAIVPAPTVQAMPGDVKLASVDGIPMRAPVDIAPATPTLGGAGNRFDIFVRPSAAATAGGPYYVYQNYPQPSLTDMATAWPDLFGSGVDAALAAARYVAVTQGTTVGNPPAVPGVSPIPVPVTDVNGATLPNLLQSDTYALGSNYQGFKQSWWNVDSNGNPLPYLAPTPGGPPGNPQSMPVAPLLRAKLRTNGKGVDIVEPSNDPSKAFGTGGNWQSMPDVGDGAAPTATILATVVTSGTPVTPPTDPMAGFAARVSSLSPAGTATALKRVNKSGNLVPGIPSYVAPITGPVDGHQVPVFDRGQFTFDYTDKATGNVQQFRQFWISGRQFDIDDSVGNPAATKLIQTPLANVEPSLGVYNPAAAANAWTHQIAQGVAGGQPQILVTNPGYFRPIKSYTDTSGHTAYNYDYSSGSYTPPTSTSLSGLAAPPSMPKSRTSEEWILINNSDLYHPFHIHISPFFVEEVGQLNYNTTTSQWSLYKTVWNSTTGKAESVPTIDGRSTQFGWVVGSWWDVIMMPPHGYVRFKTWINVPDQVPIDPSNPDSDLVVQDNANTYGSWVFHCHILRHEDRGMMSMVNTVPNPVVLGPTWYDNQQGATSVQYDIADSHGSLRVAQVTTGTPAPFAGTFNEGLGNPFISQPYAGAMNFPTAAATFCATEDAQTLLFSNGLQWSTQANAPAYPAPPATGSYLVLPSGTWTDNTESKNQATITQTQAINSTTGAITGTLTFTPVTPTGGYPVWWKGGAGSWTAGGTVNTTVNPNATPTPNLAYGGTVTFAVNPQNPQAGRNQFLSFCVSTDLKKIVFSNGITWTKN